MSSTVSKPLKGGSNEVCCVSGPLCFKCIVLVEHMNITNTISSSISTHLMSVHYLKMWLHILKKTIYSRHMNLELEINKQAITGLCHTQIPDNTSSISSLKCPGRACSCMRAVIRKWSTWDVFTHVGNSLTQWRRAQAATVQGRTDKSTRVGYVLMFQQCNIYCLEF